VERAVVIAEDEPHLRRIYGRRLAGLGYRVIETADGEAAREALLGLDLGRTRAVLVLDIMMPKLDGLSLIREMRASEVLKAIPIVVSSAVRDPQALATLAGLGVSATLTKPFRHEELLAAVERAFGAGAGEPGPGASPAAR